jgi:LPS-assembly lipoprotein
MRNILRAGLLICLLGLMTSCGFHLQRATHLAAPLHRMYLKTSDPYGQLARSLQQYLKISNVQLVTEPEQASTILSILQDTTAQDLLSVSGTQQTRQYTLKVTVVFEITTPEGKSLTGPQTLIETRTLTIQSNQVLGSSNEANLFYQQMRRTIAYAILNRISSNELTHIIENTQVIKPS